MKHRRIFNFGRVISDQELVPILGLTKECFEVTIQFFQIRVRSCSQKSPIQAVVISWMAQQIARPFEFEDRVKAAAVTAHCRE